MACSAARSRGGGEAEGTGRAHPSPARMWVHVSLERRPSMPIDIAVALSVLVAAACVLRTVRA